MKYLNQDSGFSAVILTRDLQSMIHNCIRAEAAFNTEYIAVYCGWLLRVPFGGECSWKRNQKQDKFHGLTFPHRPVLYIICDVTYRISE
jgi:hypothetical protein